MAITKYVQQVKNRQENKVDHLERISYLIQEDVMNLPIDIFRGLDYSKSTGRKILEDYFERIAGWLLDHRLKFKKIDDNF